MVAKKLAKPRESSSKDRAEAAASTSVPTVASSSEWHLDYEETAQSVSRQKSQLIASLLLILLLLSLVTIWLLT